MKFLQIKTMEKTSLVMKNILRLNEGLVFFFGFDRE